MAKHLPLDHLVRTVLDTLPGASSGLIFLCLDLLIAVFPPPSPWQVHLGDVEEKPLLDILVDSRYGHRRFEYPAFDLCIPQHGGRAAIIGKDRLFNVRC